MFPAQALDLLRLVKGTEARALRSFAHRSLLAYGTVRISISMRALEYSELWPCACWHAVHLWPVPFNACCGGPWRASLLCFHVPKGTIDMSTLQWLLLQLAGTPFHPCAQVPAESPDSLLQHMHHCF
jgi:hypothetical protein